MFSIARNFEVKVKRIQVHNIVKVFLFVMARRVYVESLGGFLKMLHYCSHDENNVTTSNVALQSRKSLSSNLPRSVSSEYLPKLITKEKQNFEELQQLPTIAY